MEVLEIVQKRFTRMLPGLDGNRHKESLDKLGIIPLEYRRLWGNPVKVRKIMRGLDEVNNQMFLIKHLRA